MSNDKCCGTCLHHWCFGPDRWVCVSDESEYEGYDTNYDDSCDDWEDRDGDN